MTILRAMGVRMIIYYIDDILIMAESEAISSEQTAREPGIHPLSHLTPTQEIDFLGFTTNFVTIEMRMPGEKKRFARRGRKPPPGNHTVPPTRQIKPCQGGHPTLFYRNLEHFLQTALEVKFLHG